MNKALRTFPCLAYQSGAAADGWDHASASNGPLPMIDRRVPRIDIRPDLESFQRPLDRRLTQDDPLGRNAAAVQPHGDLRLTDALAGEGSQLVRQSGLPASKIDDPLHSGCETLVEVGLGGRHTRLGFNTVSVIAVNTGSVFGRGQTACMPRNGKTSAFWERLTLARTTCSPPKSMTQKDLAREYQGSERRQSTVTKWKTGKSMPDPDTIVQMALETNVNVNWLWAGQGDIRPLPVTNRVVQQLVEVVNALGNSDAQLEVLRSALAERALKHSPEDAARLAEAERSVKAQQNEEQRASKQRRARTGSR